MKPIDNAQLKHFIQAGGTWKDLQRQFLKAALDYHQGNRTYVARTLGISLRTVRNKIRLWKLKEDSDETQG